MHKSKIKTWSSLIGVVVLAACVFGVVDVYQRYFFNPLTFRNNDVLYLPWSWYKKPLDMQLYTVTAPPSKLVTIKNQNEIRYVFSELEKGSLQKAIPFNQMDNTPKDQTYNILIRTKGTVGLQMVYVYPKEKLAEIWTQHGNVGENEFISLTPNLLTYVTQHFGQ